jgi:hypothetical protein
LCLRLSDGQDVDNSQLISDPVQTPAPAQEPPLQEVSPPHLDSAPPRMDEPPRRVQQAVAAISGASETPVTAVRSSPPLVGAWLNRPRRILLTLSVIWIVAIFDLGFTLSEFGTSHFVEMNPLASSLLGGSANGIIAYKFGLLSFGTFILLCLRRHAVAEMACWFLLATKFYLAVRWFCYFDCLISGYSNPLIEVG